MKLLVVDRQVVRPGDCLATLDREEALSEKELKHIPDKHIYIVGNRVFSDVVGVVSVNEDAVSVIPLEGVYIPRRDDVVIGVVEDIGITHWVVDIRSPYRAVLPGGDVIEGFNPATHNLRNYLNIGDLVLAKISTFDRLRDPLLTIRGKGLGKITEGFVIDIKPSRVGRVIGKKGSMLNVLTSMTRCEIVIGMNGYIWAKCPDENTLNTLINAIRFIEMRAHVKGLTEQVKSLIESQMGVRRE